MQKSRLINDIYKLSQTLYGAERFKLVIEAVRKIEEETGEFKDINQLPSIDTTFIKAEEYNNYLGILVDYTVANFILMEKLERYFWLCYMPTIAILMTKHKRISKTCKELVEIALGKISDYFQLLAVIEEKNKEYKIDLFTFNNRKIIENSKTLLKSLNKAFSDLLGLKEENKIDCFTASELEDNKQLINSLFGIFYKMAGISDKD